MLRSEAGERLAKWLVVIRHREDYKSEQAKLSHGTASSLLLLLC